MSKSNYTENKDGTVVVAIDYGMSWNYENATKEFPVGSYVILYGRKKCKPWRFRRAVQFY